MKLDVIEKVVRTIDCDYLGSSILYHTSYFIHLPILRSSLCIATFGRFTSFGFPYSQWFLLTTIGYCHFTTTLSDRTPPSQILRESFNVKIEIMIEQTTRYKSLNDIRLRKAQLRSDIIKDSNKNCWIME